MFKMTIKKKIIWKFIAILKKFIIVLMIYNKVII